MSGCYLDTSALAKWYVNEPGSEAFEAFVHKVDTLLVSRLTEVELRCLLARRRRAGDFDQAYERDAFITFQNDLIAGHFQLVPLNDDHAMEAKSLIEVLEVYGIALRTLDALHLALALDAGADSLATADRVMARAGEALRLVVHFFG